jgi:hypothetical protein
VLMPGPARSAFLSAIPKNLQLNYHYLYGLFI